MADVASLLLEIETAEKKKDTRKPLNFLGSLFDDEEDNDDDLEPSNKTSPLLLSITGKSCIIHSSSNDLNNNLIPIKSVKHETILTDVHDARHQLSEFDMKEIISTQQRLKSNKKVYAKQWEEDKKWHLRDEKLLLIQENTACSIDELQHERFNHPMLKKQNKTHKPDNSVGYNVEYEIPSNLIRPPTKIEHELMEKVAKWVTDKGIQFETMIKIKQANNTKFLFLTPTNAFHPYYNFLKQRFKSPHLFEPKQNNNTDNKQREKNESDKTDKTDAATSISSHFLTYYSDDSEDDSANSEQSHKSNADNKNTKRSRSRSRSNHSVSSKKSSRSRSGSWSRSRSPYSPPIKRTGKNSKRRKEMERRRRKRRQKRRYSYSDYSRSRSRSRSYSRSASRSRSRSRSLSSISSVDSFCRSKRRSYKINGRTRYYRSRSRSRSPSRSRSLPKTRNRRSKYY